MAKLTYNEGVGDGSTYGMGHNTTTLYITNEDTGEERAYSGWTYMDGDDEDVDYILHAIWEQDEDMGYGAEDMPYTVVTEGK